MSEKKALTLNSGKKEVLNNGDSIQFIDHHSGYKTIEANKKVIILENREMRVRKSIRIDGTLKIQGYLVVDG